MKLVPITCAQCDAPLRINEGTSFVVCDHCETQLHVQKSQEGLQTEIMEEILHRTDALAKEVNALKAERRVKSLDRRWRSRRRYLLKKNEAETQANPAAVFGGLTIFGAVAAMSSDHWTLGIMLLVIAAVLAAAFIRDKRGIEKARESYRRRRRKLIGSMKAPSAAQRGTSQSA